MRFARFTFAIAGCIGIGILVPMYFQKPHYHGAEFYYGFIGLAVAWQLVFLLIAKDPVKYRWVMPLAALEKISFALPLIALRSEGRAQTDIAAAVMDLTFALLFILAFGLTAHRPQRNHPL